MKKFAFNPLTRIVIVCSMLIALFPDVYSQSEKAPEKNLDMSVMINQAGYLPDAPKYCVVKESSVRDFEVLNVVSGETVFKGTLTPAGNDLGNYMTGVFTSVKQPGTYFIRSGKGRSFPFRISRQVYDEPEQLILSYFSKQRCGNSTTGYLSPCHLDDGVRLDNKKHQDVSGGWHDASDVRKWVDATIFAMVGMLRMTETIGDRYNDRVTEELLWGNRYFLNMQEPEGYVMSHVGGDVFKHADSNRWTDTEIGTDDDRIIQTKPAENVTQYMFVAVEAEMSRFMKKDPAYSRKCLDASVNCFDWCVKTVKEYTATAYGSAVIAGIELYKATGDTKYRDFVFAMADKMLLLQVTNQAEPLSGFFKASEKGDGFCQEIYVGDLTLIGLCKLIETFPQHTGNEKYVEAVKRYCYQYVRFISDKNAFALVPYGVYPDRQGGDRKIGKYWYRYYMNPDQEWWVGINSNIAGKAIGLSAASRILNDPALAVIAQRQLDWILGANPFGVSTMMGVGYSHPDIIPLAFVNKGEFRPATPHIPGAVLNGIGGDRNDMPDLFPGSWQTCEYWTPMICYTLWLMAELSAN